MGLWYGSEVITHLGNEDGETIYDSCVVIHLTDTTNTVSVSQRCLGVTVVSINCFFLRIIAVPNLRKPDPRSGSTGSVRHRLRIFRRSGRQPKESKSAEPAAAELQLPVATAAAKHAPPAADLGGEGTHPGVQAAVQQESGRLLDVLGPAGGHDDKAAVRALFRYGAGPEGRQQPAGVDVLPEPARESAVYGGAVAPTDGTVAGGEWAGGRCS